MSIERNEGKGILREVAQSIVGFVIITVVIGLAALLVLSPGIIINGLRGKYKNRGSQNIILTIFGDGETWLISLAFAATAFILLSIFGAFSSDKAVVDVRSSLPQPEYDSPAALPDRDVITRRAIPVTQPSPAPDHSALNPVPSPAQPTAAHVLYWGVAVAPGDTLNVRLGPGMHYPTIERLSNGFDDIQVVEPTVMNEQTEWVKIVFGEKTGWVSKRYLKAQVSRIEQAVSP